MTDPVMSQSAPRPAATLWALRLAGVAAAAAVWLAMGAAEGVLPDARWVAAIATLMAIWWMTEAIPLAVTSLLPIVIVPAVTG
ncbi:MAG: anion permease, partial [Novosphingopyxis baekryungensis]|nr:anion permease [Novosphingopyxis baekryungensis]